MHSEFSYDTGPSASMRLACERAVALGVPGIAFTEHLDFVKGGADDPLTQPVEERRWWHPLDADAYLAAIAECRERFPALRILSGVESGEPHWFSGSLAHVLAGDRFGRVLGSCHRVLYDGVLRDVGSLFPLMPAADVVRLYFGEVLRLAESTAPYQVLAHVDFVRRYLPPGSAPYDEATFEEEYRAIFRALAPSGRALELNTKTPLASVQLLSWWYEAGGSALSFGSDAHEHAVVGRDFARAAGVAEAAGFRPGPQPYDLWRR